MKNESLAVKYLKVALTLALIMHDNNILTYKN